MGHSYPGRAGGQAALSKGSDFAALLAMLQAPAEAREYMAEILAAQDKIREDLATLDQAEATVAARAAGLDAIEAKQTDVATNLATDRAKLDQRIADQKAEEDEFQKRVELLDAKQAAQGAELAKGFEDLNKAKADFAEEMGPKRADVEQRRLAVVASEQDLKARIAEFEERYAKAKAILEAVGNGAG